jgi:hypothetical protein
MPGLTTDDILNRIHSAFHDDVDQHAALLALVQSTSALHVNNALQSGTYTLSQSGTGDVSLLFNLKNGPQTFALGIDNSDSDRFKVTAGTTLGTNDAITITNSADIGIGTSAPANQMHLIAGPGADGYALQSNAANVSPAYIFRDNTGAIQGYLGMSDGSGGYATDALHGDLIVRSQSNNIIFTANGGPGGNDTHLYIATAGEVGIGKIPTAGKELDVSGDIRTDAQLESTVATGTAPLVVASTTNVPNLNADTVDGSHASAFATSGHGHSTLSGLTDIEFAERSSDPTTPAEGNAIMWMSDGTGTGNDGDILIRIRAGGTVKTATLVDFGSL